MELEIENYNADSGFEDFYNRNMPRIRKKLKGRKMKKRHLKNAKALLDESTGLPEKVKEEIILDGIEETVTEADLNSYEGDEFDHFGFANKIKKKAVATKNQRINSLKTRILPRRKPVSSKAIQNGQLGSPAKAVGNISPALPSKATTQMSPPLVSAGTGPVESEETTSSELSTDPTHEETLAAKGTTKLASKGKNLLAGLTALKPPITDIENPPVKKGRTKLIVIIAGVLVVAAIVIVYIRKRKA